MKRENPSTASPDKDDTPVMATPEKDKADPDVTTTDEDCSTPELYKMCKCGVQLSYEDAYPKSINWSTNNLATPYCKSCYGKFQQLQRKLEIPDRATKRKTKRTVTKKEIGYKI